VSLTQQFLEAPHTFANEHALCPYADAPVNQQHIKSLSLEAIDKPFEHFQGDSKVALNDNKVALRPLEQVQGDNKVAFCDILPCNMVNPFKGDGGASYTQDKDLCAMRITNDRPGPSAAPVYYLPWKSNTMMRIKLKPSRKHARQESGATLDPGLFVTAALQGCTVIVTGDRQEPVVYHLNAGAQKGPNQETLGAAQAPQWLSAAQAKVDNMRALFNAAQSQKPKEGPRAVGGGHQPLLNPLSAEVDLMDYVYGMAPGPAAVLAKRYKLRFGAKSVSVAMCGTVFGIRNAEGWVFYRQTRTRVGYPLHGTDTWIYVWVDPVCTKFWP
jgi:hypothetical protein